MQDSQFGAEAMTILQALKVQTSEMLSYFDLLSRAKSQKQFDKAMGAIQIQGIVIDNTVSVLLQKTSKPEYSISE